MLDKPMVDIIEKSIPPLSITKVNPQPAIMMSQDWTRILTKFLGFENLGIKIAAKIIYMIKKNNAGLF
jgi:hypothetical protein